MRITKRVLALFVASVMLAATVPCIASAETGSFYGWNWSTNDLSGSITIDSNVKHSGTSSAKLECSTPRTSGKYLWFYTTFNVVAGKTYEYGMWTKSRNTEKCYCDIEWISGTDKELLPIGPSNDWIDSQFEWTAPTSRSVRFMFILEGTSDGFWIDDVYFREKGTTTNLIANGGFESGAASVADVESLYNGVMENGSFSVEQLQNLSGVIGYIPTKKAQSIVVDADSADWSNYVPINMPTMSKQIQVFMSDGDEKDLKATVKTAYDDNHLYLMFDVTDNTFYPINRGRTDFKYWEGDSIQFAISEVEEDLVEGEQKELNPDEIEGYDFGTGTGGVSQANQVKFGKEISVVCNPNSLDAELYSSYVSEENLKQITAKAKNSGEHTVYEIKIPWDAIFENGKPKEKLLFNFLVNDNDGTGRRYCVEMTDGISRSKDNTNFPFLELIDAENDFYSWIIMDKSTGIYGGYDLFIVNDNENERIFEIYDNYEKKQSTVTIPPKSGIKIRKDFSNIGEFQIICNITCGEKTIKAKARTIVSDSLFCTPEFAEDLKNRTASQAAEIKELLDRCEEKGITTDYETASYAILERFVSYIQQDMDQGFYKAMYFYDKGLNQVYEEAKESLNKYLAGEKVPFEIPRYITSDEGVTIDGGHFVATTDTNGAIERRPVFFTGWGHFNSASKDVPNFQKFGFNVVQNGFKIRDIIGMAGQGKAIPGETEYSIITNQALVWTPDLLKKAEASNIAIDAVFEPHTFAQFVLDNHPDLITGSPEFIKYNIMDERAKKVVRLSLEAIIPLIKDSKALSSICITNEPIFRTAISDDFFRPYWADYLNDIYSGDISKLNYNYGTTYQSFDEVEFPEINTYGNSISISDARDYDYCNFNAVILSTWHKFICDTIRELAPNVPLHSKIHLVPKSTDWHSSMRSSLDAGVYYQYHANLFDLNGNDGGTYLTNQWKLRELDYEQQIDYQKTFKTAPIVNSEDHILQDRMAGFEPIHSDYAAWQIWQGAVHGKGMTEMWVWEWDYSPSSALYGSLMRRPDAISQLSKISLDLMRLSYEVVALQDDEPEVALLYSDASRVYSDTYAIGCYAAYESLRYAGKSVQFITETGVDVPTKLANCRVLVIPETMQIKEDMPEKIAEFMKKGGKVILFNQNSLCNNEYNKPLIGSAKEASDYIRQNATIVEKGKQETDSLGDWSFEDCHNYFKDYLRSNGMDYIRLIDAKTGKEIDYVEMNTAIYDGKLLVNLNNLREDAEVKLIVDGNVVENSKELRCGESFGETFALKKYKPILLSIDVRNLFIDTYNHWAEETISKLADEGVVKGVSAGRFVPEKAISRVEFATLLSRAFQLNVDPSTGYANWYDGVVREANANGIELGELSAPLNREDAAELVASYYEKFVSPIDASPTSYLDKERFDNSAAIDKASNLGAMQGYPDGDFRPEKLLTRAEATVIIERVLERTK